MTHNHNSPRIDVVALTSINVPMVLLPEIFPMRVDVVVVVVAVVVVVVVVVVFAVVVVVVVA